MDVEKLSNSIGIKYPWVREFLAELLGTFLLVFLGNNSVAYVVFNEGTAMSMFFVHLGFGLGLTLAILVSGGVSGGHVNPAVTLCMVVIGRLKWQKMFHYFAAQYIGALIAAIFTYVLYYDALANYNVGIHEQAADYVTAGIWATFPAPYVTLGGAFLDQILGTFVFLLLICAITDSKNMEIAKGMVALYIGLVLFVVSISLGMNTGGAVNPARDLSPRLFILCAGWGSDVFTRGDFPFWWMPIVGTHIGGVLGGLVYVFAIELHLHKARSGGDGGDAV